MVSDAFFAFSLTAMDSAHQSVALLGRANPLPNSTSAADLTPAQLSLGESLVFWNRVLGLP